MSRRPRILGELGAELDRAARADLRGRRRLFGWHRGPLLALLIAFGAGGVAVAGTQLLGEGQPLEPPRAADVVSGSSPQPGSARLAGAVTPDPAGDRPWRLRLSRTSAGDVCTAVGQTVEDRFGIVGLDRVFRPTPLGVGDTCSRAPRGSAVVTGARVFAGRSAPQARTVVAGLAGPDVRELRLVARGSARTLEISPDRVFITVLAGYAEDLQPKLQIRGSGPRRTLTFADTGRDEVADPEGGNPWAIENRSYREPGAPRGLSCAQATRPVPLDQRSIGSGPLTPLRCGFLRSSPGFAVARRFVPSATPRDGFPWGLNPARTLAYGGVAPTVARVEVRGPDGLVRQPRIFRPSGAWLVVLDGRIDPRGLRTILTLRDGTTRTLDDTAAAGTRGQPLRDVAPPRWRSLSSQQAKVSTGFAVPIASSFRDSAPVADPAGGPAWVLRAFKGTPAKNVRFGPEGPPSGFACFVAGPRVDGQLRRATSGAPGRRLDPAREGDAFCNEDERPKRLAAAVVAYAGDPGGYDPGLSRIAVTGQVPRATKLELLGLGAPRSLPLTGDGAFLALLPGSTRAELRLRATFTDGRTLAESPRGGELTVGDGRVDARTSDPDGTAPWAATSAADRRFGRCQRYGRLVLNRFASISEDDGSVRFGDAGSSCGTAVSGLTRKRPLALTVQPQVAFEASAPTPAQIQRRTRPGRTLIAGTARSDVAEIELRTPRDIRLLRPTGPGRSFIAVYDGIFSGGRIEMKIRFTDGRTRILSQPAAF